MNSELTVERVRELRKHCEPHGVFYGSGFDGCAPLYTALCDHWLATQPSPDTDPVPREIRERSKTESQWPSINAFENADRDRRTLLSIVDRLRTELVRADDAEKARALRSKLLSGTML